MSIRSLIHGHPAPGIPCCKPRQPARPSGLRFACISGVSLSLCVALCSALCCEAAELYGVTGSGGNPSATLHRISPFDASVTPVLQLNDAGGGQVIAYNSDDGFLYHWTGFPAANAILERINLDTHAVTNVPLTGFPTNEVYSAVYDPAAGVFLTTDLSRNFCTVTPDGMRTFLGTTVNWVRGLAFVGNTLYGGHNSLVPVNSLFTIDAANGAFLTVTPVTLAGFTVAGFVSQAMNPDTGELWALLMVEEIPKKTRLLATIDLSTGVATLVGALPSGSGFSSIAFVPDPVTFASLAEGIVVGCEAGLIDNSGIAQSLLARLTTALKAVERGNIHAAIGILQAFALEVRAQAGLHIDPEQAGELLDDVAALAGSIAETP